MNRIARRVGVFDPYRVPVVETSTAQAVQVAAISIHHPDLAVPGTIGPEDDLRPVGRPGWVFVPPVPLIPSQLKGTATVTVGDPDLIIAGLV